MSKGQQRGNKEAKKPKAPRAVPAPPQAGLPVQGTPPQNPTPRGPKR